MDRLFRSGLAVDIAIAFLVLEWIVLILIRNRPSVTIRPAEFLANGGAGAALLLALRAALQDLAWPHVALWLLVALGFHAWDLTLRWSMHRTG